MPLDPTDTCHRLQVFHNIQVFQGQVRMPWVPDENLRVGVVLGGGEWVLDASEQSRVVQLPFGAHNSIGTGGFEACVNVGLVQDVPVSENGDRNSFFDCSDFVPVCQTLEEQ